MHSTLEVMMTDDPAGNFAWQIMSNTLCYAADLVPEISNDVVNVDRAMRWGYAWNRGPFEISIVWAQIVLLPGSATRILRYQKCSRS